MTNPRPLADLDWPEDAGQENGAYSCICADCGRMFVGHKRRVTCRACATRPKTHLADLVARLRDDIDELERDARFAALVPTTGKHLGIAAKERLVAALPRLLAERKEAAAALEECARERDEAREAGNELLQERVADRAVKASLLKDIAELESQRIAHQHHMSCDREVIEGLRADKEDLERRLAAPLPEEIEPLLLDMRRWVASTRKQAHPWDALINNTLCLADRAADLLARTARALADAQQEAAILRKEAGR